MIALFAYEPVSLIHMAYIVQFFWYNRGMKHFRLHVYYDSFQLATDWNSKNINYFTVNSYSLLGVQTAEKVS